MENKNLTIIVWGILLVVMSNIIGHFFAPFSILITPILLTVIIGVLNARLYASNFILTLFYNFTLLFFNDLLIRFTAGGTHDQAGKAWIFLLSAIAFALAFLTMVIYAITTVNEQDKALRTKKVLKNILLVLVFTTLAGLFYRQVFAGI